LKVVPPFPTDHCKLYLSVERCRVPATIVCAMNTLHTYTDDEIQVPVAVTRDRTAEPADTDEDDRDGLRAARGITLGAAVGLGLWILILAGAWLIFR